ncbi:MAG: adenosyl-hopene transferase HpnH, partial [Planctomycetia bacterium]
DGPKKEHDYAVCRMGTYDVAAAAVKKAVSRGFRVTTNTTLFEGADPEKIRGFFDDMMKLGVEGMMVSPGYSYPKAPDQDHFLHRAKTRELFRTIFGNPKRHWKFNQSPLFIRFLMGKEDYDCTPWGNPTYNLFGWQKPCYLMQEGYAATFKELMEATDWSQYGGKSGNKKCSQCMVHSGHEPTAVQLTFNSLGGFVKTAKASLGGGF